jgi:hypothetical protein
MCVQAAYFMASTYQNSEELKPTFGIQIFLLRNVLITLYMAREMGSHIEILIISKYCIYAIII